MTGNPHNRTILRPDHRLMEVCESIRCFVETINRVPSVALRGSYRTLDKTSVFSERVAGVVIGYKLEEHATFMRRKVFIKVPGYKIEDVSDKEREAIMVAVMEAFIDQQQGLPEIAQIAPDCMLIQQDFLPMYLIERHPNLVSLAGGVDVDDKGIIQ